MQRVNALLIRVVEKIGISDFQSIQYYSECGERESLR